MSTTYAYTVQQAINRAFRLMGVYDRYSSGPDATDTANALEAANLIAKIWNATPGIKLWLLEEVSLPFVAGRSAYALGPTGNVIMDMPLRITNVILHDALLNTDITLRPLSREGYLGLAVKSLQSMPTQYWYVPGSTAVTARSPSTPHPIPIRRPTVPP